MAVGSLNEDYYMIIPSLSWLPLIFRLFFSVASYLRDEASAVITDHLSHFVLISASRSHSAATPTSRGLKAECVRLVVTSRLSFVSMKPSAGQRREKVASRTGAAV